MVKKFFKKSTSLLLAILLIISMAAPVYAIDNSIQVQLNGENISFDVAPQMVNNRILVPMRTIFEELGANVEWDNQTRTITATHEETVIELNLNNQDAYIIKNGVSKKLQLDAAPIIVKGKTLVPVRFISESMGKQVGWDGTNKTVILIDYDYFLNALKQQAPNFFAFASNKYEVLNSGESNSSGDISFKYNSGIESESVNGNIKANFNAKIDTDKGSMDAVIKMSGLDDLLSKSGLDKIDSVTFNILFDNNSFYVKSNLFSLLEQEGINIGSKWIKADIKDLNIPDVKTLEDLKRLQNQQSYEQVAEALVNTPVQLDVNSFSEAQTVFNAFVTLVDNNHFTLTNKGDKKVYTWNIKKQDLIDIALKIQKDSGSFENITMEDLAEIREFVDTLEFDYNMVAEVENNIVVNSRVSLNAKMDFPEVGYFELTLKTDSEVLNPNNAHFIIEMPDSSNVLDFKELLAQ